jgi:hypothetical protein
MHKRIQFIDHQGKRVLLKETAVFDKPFVRKSALIGTEDLPASFYDELKSYSRRDC